MQILTSAYLAATATACRRGLPALLLVIDSLLIPLLTIVVITDFASTIEAVAIPRTSKGIVISTPRCNLGVHVKMHQTESGIYMWASLQLGQQGSDDLLLRHGRCALDFGA